MTDTDRLAPAPPAAPPHHPHGAPWALVVLLAVLAAFGAGYFAHDTLQGQPEASASPSPGINVSSPAAEIANKVVPTVVLVRAEPATGSGFVYDASGNDGLVFTAAHVVGDNETVTLRFADGVQIDAKVLGKDEQRDVAVILAKYDSLEEAPLAKGKPVRMGDYAVAVGNPYGLRGTITAGVVSGIGRQFVTPTGVVDAIHTDVLVNPGNSGGPLVNGRGEVIGMNIARKDDIGVAVPIDVLLETAVYLEQGKEAPPVPFLGIQGSDPTDDREGALVAEARLGAPAHEAGIRNGDLITHIDGKRVTGMFELAAEVRKHKPGDSVVLLIQRRGKQRTVELQLERYER